MSHEASMKRIAVIFENILDERKRQEDLRKEGKFLHTCASDGITSADRLAILSEEHGEIARDVNEIQVANAKRNATGDVTWNQDIAARKRHARKELIQLAACCVAWVEYLDRKAEAS